MSRKVALLIGVTEYGEGIPSLSAPLNDVEAMKRVLENQYIGGFKVEILINPNVVTMRRAVEKILKDYGKDDLVLLFFSGHGITDDENQLYFATKETCRDSYRSTSVAASFVQNISQKYSYPKRQVIILDCCYSGAFAAGWQNKSIELDLKKELKEKLGAEGRVVLASSKATQPSFQQKGEKLSLYTKYIVKGIETGGADENGDGKIYVRELHDYVKAEVRKEKPKQEPYIIIDNEGYNILLCQAPVKDQEKVIKIDDFILKIKPIPPDKPNFWMAEYFISNELYYHFVCEKENWACKANSEGAYLKHWKYGKPNKNQLKLPITNISFKAAEAFVEWLSQKSKIHCELPTEEQWQIAIIANNFPSYEQMYRQWKREVYKDDSESGNKWLKDKFGNFNYHSTKNEISTIDYFFVNPFGIYDLLGNVYDICIGKENSSIFKLVGGCYHSTANNILEPKNAQPEEILTNASFRFVINRGEF